MATSVWGGCGSSDDGGTTGGDQNVTSGANCVVTNQLTGQKMTAEDLAKLDDPVAKFLLTTAGCPQKFSEITAKFRKLDTDGCPDLGTGKVASGVQTRLIGERAQELNQPDSYRIVTSRQCNKRDPFGLFLSSFNISATAPLNEGFVELIAEDKTRGVFDYYSQEGGRWTFFGSSIDFIDKGYNCANGACVPKTASTTRCAACHIGGGLNMKELHSPWVFWDLGSLPGARETIAKFPDVLGSQTSGIDLEGRVAPANVAWVKTRATFLKTKGVGELLRPLFCTMDMNLQTSSSQAGGLTSLPSDFFVDRTFQGGFPQVDNADYMALIKSRGQTLPTGKTDTPFAFIYPERSAQDLAYQAELISQKIVDDDLVRDILHVDFTRPAYSVARCDLVKFAPTLTAAQMTPDAIRAGFKASLAGQTGAAATLLANLNAAGDQAAHQADVNAFFAACTARPKKDLLTDAMAWAAHLRRTVRGVRDPRNGGIIEFAESMPSDSSDKQADITTFFNPKTCILQ